MKVINRIKSNEDFANTVKKGHTIKSSSYIIHYLNNDFNLCRIGISCSKKIGNAVIRNRIRRQIRAMCDSTLQYNDHALDVVVIVRSDYLTNNYQQNLQQLENNFREIGIVK